MSYRFYGLLSVLFLVIAMGISIVSVLIVSSFVGILYLVLLCLFLIPYCFCGKIYIRKRCSRGVRRKFIHSSPASRCTKRNSRDYIITVVVCLVVAAFPQYYLFKIIPAFLLYWLLIGIAIVEFYVAVCKKSKNKGCSFRGSMK